MRTLLERLEDIIRLEFGTADLAAMRARAGLPMDDATPFTQVAALIRAVAYIRRRSPEEMFTWAGAKLAAPLVTDHPNLLKPHVSVRTMLLQVSQLAPTVVQRLSPGSTCPDFWEDLLDGETTRISFDGPEEVASALEGVLRGLAAHYGEWVAVTRGTPPAVLPERRQVEAKVRPERRTENKTPPAGADRRGPTGGFFGVR